jgi:hypothetical protein
MGPACGWCGLMPPVFTCFQCGTRQGLYMPGMAVQQAMGPGLVAPVFSASEGASQNQLVSGIMGGREDIPEGSRQAGRTGRGTPRGRVGVTP